MANTKWTLDEMIDLETCLHRHGDDIKGDRLIEANIVSPLLEEHQHQPTAKKKNIAFKAWLDHRLKDTKTKPSEYWNIGYFNLQFILCILLFIAGISGVLGLMNWEQKSFNLGVLLAVSLVLPWVLFLLVGGIYLASKGKMHPWFSLFSSLSTKFWHKAEKHANPVKENLQSFKSPLKKKFFNSLQLLSLVYSFGCLAGILCAIFFLEVSIYWEATPTGNMASFWHSVTQFLSLPWQWSGSVVPTMQDVEMIRLSDFSTFEKNAATAEKWAYFCMLSILVWSCVPRVVFYLLGLVNYRLSLSMIKFDDSRHRQLWRRLCTQSLDAQHEIQSDIATFIDLGGSGIQLESILPFVHEKLKLKPTEVFMAGTLNEEENRRTELQLKAHAQPVILCCEASEFLPKSLESQLEKIKLFQRRDMSIFILLIGSGMPSSPTETQADQWLKWVDHLADPSIDLVVYEEIFSAAPLASPEAQENGENAEYLYEEDEQASYQGYGTTEPLEYIPESTPAPTHEQNYSAPAENSPTSFETPTDSTHPNTQH